MSIESQRPDLREIAVNSSLSKRFLSELGRLANYRDVGEVKEHGFDRAIEKIEARLSTSSALRGMLDFRSTYFNLGLDEAIQSSQRRGIAVKVIVPNIDSSQFSNRAYLEKASTEEGVAAKLIGIIKFCDDEVAPTFDGIAVVGTGEKKDYVAVRVSKTGSVWLNPAHLTGANEAATDREIIEGLFPRE